MWKGRVSNRWRAQSISAPVDAMHPLNNTSWAWQAWGGPGGGGRLTQDWPRSLMGEVSQATWGTQRTTEDGRSLAKEACGFRSQRQKGRGRVEDSQHGRRGSRAKDLSAQDPKSHMPSREHPPPRAASTQGPLSQPPIPCLGGWELGAPREEGMSLRALSCLHRL